MEERQVEQMSEHPIQGLMRTAMENLKEMVDVNKIVGDPVETPDGHVIIPVSKVTFGFVAGGSEYNSMEDGSKKTGQNLGDFPFGGGSGGGVSVQPVAFLVVGPGEIRLLPVDKSAVFERLVDLAPQVIQYIQRFFKENNIKKEC